MFWLAEAKIHEWLKIKGHAVNRKMAMKLFLIKVVCLCVVLLTLSCQKFNAACSAQTARSTQKYPFFGIYNESGAAFPSDSKVCPLIPMLPSHRASSESSFHLLSISELVYGIMWSYVGEVVSTNEYQHGYIVYDIKNKVFYIGFSGGGFKENAWKFIAEGFPVFVRELNEYRKTIGIHRNENTDVVFVLSETPEDKDLKCLQLDYLQFIITHKTIYEEGSEAGLKMFHDRWKTLKASELFRRKREKVN